METIECSININASQAKVWAALWEKDNYTRWTVVFGEGNIAISDWQEGSKIQFVAKDGGGMYGIIEKKVINEQIIFKHLGEIKNGQEVAGDWEGAREKYILINAGDTTTLKVEMDSNEAYADYFKSAFPTALAAVKEIAEHII